MSIIPCSRNCGMQSEGYCMLESAGAVTNTAGGCPHFVSVDKSRPPSFQQTGTGLPDRANRLETNG